MSLGNGDAKYWVLLAGAVTLILLTTIPWGNFQNHSHWAQVQWVPFLARPVKIRDAIGNILLYVPFGVALSRKCSRGVLQATLFALALSSCAECAQVFSHNRVPSATDVACNVGGAAGAAAVCQMRRRGKVR